MAGGYSDGFLDARRHLGRGRESSMGPTAMESTCGLSRFHTWWRLWDSTLVVSPQLHQAKKQASKQARKHESKRADKHADRQGWCDQLSLTPDMSSLVPILETILALCLCQNQLMNLRISGGPVHSAQCCFSSFRARWNETPNKYWDLYNQSMRHCPLPV